MTKNSNRTGTMRWSASPRRVSETTKQALADALGLELDEVGNAIVEVEDWLAAYSGAVQALDNAMRPMDYIAVLGPIRKASYELANDLASLGDSVRDALQARGVSVTDTILALGKVIDAAGEIVREKESESSKGPPKRKALRQMIAGLRKIFNRHHTGESSIERARSGTSETLSAREYDELEFVKAALDDAGIDYPINVRRYFD